MTLLKYLESLSSGKSF